jgi:hypothetical protein
VQIGKDKEKDMKDGEPRSFKHYDEQAERF